MIDDPDLLLFLQTEQNRATDDDLNESRKTALEFYRGDPFGDEVDGRSKLVTRDVAEVVDYMTVSVMRTLVSGDRIVEFEPSRPGQEEAAQEATDRIHWNFLREQDGYSVLHDGIKAGLLEKTGIWKSWVERPYRQERRQLNALELEQAGDDVLDAEPIEDLIDIDEMGEPLAVYDALVRIPQAPVFRDAAIPNDEFFVSPDARTLDTAPYCGNIARVSLADLVGMGYTLDDVEPLWGEDNDGQNLRDARDSERGGKERDSVRNGLHRVVTLREEYCRWLWDGVYQLVRVHRVNASILSVEPVAFQPYTLWSPFPTQHRLVGQSLADKTMDIQVVRSHMLRQAMDALYLSNAPRIAIPESGIGANTINDVLDVAPGGLIRYAGAVPPTPFQQPFAAEPAFRAMEVMAGEKESRTGITRLNQGLDADALNKTATGTALMQASGQQIEEYIARNAANAVGELFEKKLRLMQTAMQPHDFRIDGEFRTVDPSAWPEDMRLAVRVGLGSGNKDRKLQSIMMLKQTQGEIYELDPRMVGPEQAFATAKLLTSTLGLGLATQFFVDPATLPQQGEKPDPAMAKVQAEAQLKAQQQQADQQAKMAEKQFDAQMRQMEAQAKAEVEMIKAQSAAETARQRAMYEANLAEAKADFEAQMAMRKIAFEESLAMRQREDTNLPDDRPGGRLDA